MIRAAFHQSRANRRVTTLLALLFVLAAASQAAAATKVLRFGKLIDGTGRVFTNAVVVVEDDRVQRVASGNVPIPPGAEVIDLSRYTGIPGLTCSPVFRRRATSGVTCDIRASPRLYCDCDVQAHVAARPRPTARRS